MLIDTFKDRKSQRDTDGPGKLASNVTEENNTKFGKYTRATGNQAVRERSGRATQSG